MSEEISQEQKTFAEELAKRLGEECTKFCADKKLTAVEEPTIKKSNDAIKRIFGAHTTLETIVKDAAVRISKPQSRSNSKEK